MALVESNAAFLQLCNEIHATGNFSNALAAQNIGTFSAMAFSLGTPQTPPTDQQFDNLAVAVFRLVGDSSISNVNGLCRIREKIELPGISSIGAFVSRHAHQDWIAFSLDFNKAHKRVKIHPSEQVATQRADVTLFLAVRKRS